MFDANLTASVQPVTNETTPSDQVVVDGSDYDDTVHVLAFNPAAGTITIQLKNSQINQTSHPAQFPVQHVPPDRRLRQGRERPGHQ